MEFKSQIATTREQSEKLLALGLKPETADMSIPIKDNPNKYCSARAYKNWNGYWKHNRFVIPAWSLSRLLELLPSKMMIGSKIETCFCLSHDNSENTWTLSYISLKYFETESPFDSCIEAISWLIKKEKFNKEYLK